MIHNRTIWKEWPHFPSTAECRVTDERYVPSPKSSRKITHEVSSRLPEICRLGMFRQIEHGIYHRRRPRAYPSAR